MILRWWFGALCASLMMLPLATSPARAHDGLQRSSPAKDAHLASAPRSLRLTFTNAPQLPFTRVQLLGPGDVPVALAALKIDSVRTVVADVAGLLTAGTYTVVWQVAGADGHPVRGRFTFTIAPGASGLGVSHAEHAAMGAAPAILDTTTAHHDPTSMPSGAGFDAESPGFVVVRGVTFASLLALLGTIAFAGVVLPIARRRGPAERVAALIERAKPRAAALGLAAGIVLVMAAIARLGAQSYAMHGADDVASASLLRGMLLQTTWGWGWLVHAAAALVALIAFMRARRGSSTGWIVAGVAALIIPFTLSVSGHAASVPNFAPVAIAADGLHILGAGGWLGSLLLVVVVGIPSALSLPSSDRGPAVADLVNAFSPTALVFAGMVATTGLFAAWLHLGAISDLWTTEYGLALLRKFVVLSVVGLTGAYNWLRVRPALGDVAGAGRMRKSASVELAVGLVVIALTAILVATPTPLDAPAATH